MPTQKDVEDFVVEHLRARYPKARQTTLHRSTNLVQAGVLDSFAFLELIAEVEKRFNVQVDVAANDFDVLSTLGGLCDAVADG